MFFYFSLFAATIFWGRLGLGRDYILNNYGILKTLNKDSYAIIPMSNGKNVPFIIARSSYWSMIKYGSLVIMEI